MNNVQRTEGLQNIVLPDICYKLRLKSYFLNILNLRQRLRQRWVSGLILYPSVFFPTLSLRG